MSTLAPERDELDGWELVHVELPGVSRLIAVEPPSSLEAALLPLIARLVEQLATVQPDEA